MPLSLRQVYPFLLTFTLALPQVAGGGTPSQADHSSTPREQSGTHRVRSSKINPLHIDHLGPVRNHTFHRSRPHPPSAATHNKHGKIKRSAAARHEFMKQTGYPRGRPGYVVDHIVPLSKGGTDDPSNMQWQTKDDAKAKDKWERGGHSTSSHTKTKHESSH